MDRVSYRIGFEDAADVIFGIVNANDKCRACPGNLRQEILGFILQERQAKADGILADLEIYRTPVPFVIARASRTH